MIELVVVGVLLPAAGAVSLAALGAAGVAMNQTMNEEAPPVPMAESDAPLILVALLLGGLLAAALYPFAALARGAVWAWKGAKACL